MLTVYKAYSLHSIWRIRYCTCFDWQWNIDIAHTHLCLYWFSAPILLLLTVYCSHWPKYLITNCRLTNDILHNLHQTYLNHLHSLLNKYYYYICWIFHVSPSNPSVSGLVVNRSKIIAREIRKRDTRLGEVSCGCLQWLVEGEGQTVPHTADLH